MHFNTALLHFIAVIMINEEFINFYKQNLQLAPKEFDTFLNTLEKPLPYVFRVEDANVDPLFRKNNNFEKVSFFKNVYQCDFATYKALPNRDVFTNFILIGKIYRQELVSMLPVHYLNIQQDSTVIDMCAAPGSKSTQIMKMLNTGHLVSNDANRKRAEILKSHVNNYNKFNVLITNNDARNYPKLKFDRVLCDVPCSGDGTMRKNHLVAKNWKPRNMFGTQYAILKRGLEMLNDDGLLVYSTCSFNPIENEAVVQKAVIELGCTVMEVDKIEGMKMRCGLQAWDPMVEKTEANKWMLPADKKTGIENCMRLLPHDNNTGGFFLAVLKKCVKAKSVRDINVKENKSTCNLDEIDNSKHKNSVKANKPEDLENNGASITIKPFYESQNKVDKFYDVSEYKQLLIEKQFGITTKNLKFISQSETANSISLVTKQLYEIMKSARTLNIISGGCKSFLVNGHKGVETTSFRAKVGILNLFEFDCKRILHLNDSDAQKFLINETVINDELLAKFGTLGINVVKFGGMEEYFCVWVGRNTSNLLVDKHFKKALKSIIK